VTNLLAIISLGFLLGMRHATDADHVVAVATIVARSKKLGTSWFLGACWGLGHTITVFLVGVAIILLKVKIPVRVGLSMEFAVGLALVALGLLNISGYNLGSWGIPKHNHPHNPEDPEHHHEVTPELYAMEHAHTHAHEISIHWLDRLVQQTGTFQILRASVVGLVHGLAGSAAVALLVLTLIGSPRAAVLYLLIFGAGTLAGMLILSALMELTMLRFVNWWKNMDQWLTVATGLISLAFGLYVMVQIGFVDGLFLGAVTR